ncbi:tandem-95 repeat protein, partial [Oleiphilus sp. HI0066]|uniref:tandem-95 repeat protein n=2 Tax=unclassified Oleiphilus TaxID=2631174 RepID=UPI000A98410A
TAQANIVVVPVNDFPVSGNLAYAIDEDGSITLSQEQLLAQASDVDGDTLTALNLQTANPELTITDNGDGTFTLTPAANFNGDLDISFDVFDGEATVAANIDLTVNPVNDAPVVSANISVTIEEDGTYTLTQAELLQFASDVDGDDLTAIIGDQGSETTITGTVLDAETGSPVFGADVTLSDAVGNATTVQTGNSGNYSVTGQVAGDGTLTITQDGAITNSFSVLEGETINAGTISLSSVMDAADMRIVLTWGGESGMRDLDNHLWLYDPDSGAELDHIYYQDMSYELGDATIQQDVDDTNGYGPETITVPNYAEANMHYSVHNYSTGAWDIDGVDNVQVQVFVGNSLVSTFTPDLPDSTTGEYWHVFDIVDGVIIPSQVVSNQSSVTMPDSDTVTEDQYGVSISDVINGLTDDDSQHDNQQGDDESSYDGQANNNDALSVSNIEITNGIVIDNDDGTYTIVPAADFYGDFSISYTVEDGNGGVTPALVDVTVTGVNDLPVAQDQNFQMNEDGTITLTDGDLLAGASDVDGDTLSISDVTYTGTDGIFTDNGDDTYTFAPNENFNGNVTVD